MTAVQTIDRRRAGGAAAAVAGLALALLAGPALAQSPPFQPKAGASAPAKGGPPPARAPQAKSAEGAAGGTDAGLRQRVEQLEEQLVDLQVVIGTLESLARTPGAASASPTFRSGPGGGAGLSAAEAGRLDGLETQIRALTAQVEQLAERLSQGGGAPPPVARAEPPPRAPQGGFGTTTIQPGGDGGRVLSDGGPQLPAQGRVAVAPPPAIPPSADGQAPKQLYETAYGYLLQQDYASAEAAFDDFLRRYPNDPLAGNAQYWLGESHFVRGQYKAAAGAFLKGYQTYARSNKAPDSLLKLAMSLDRLGQRDAACSSYGELGQRFPNAPSHIRSRADSERRRVGCP
jgi:tol-pal system protein YbgF